jgi:alkylhydroperoxidase/carboxymuconolactone decarboxylase family protein YurZ
MAVERFYDDDAALSIVPGRKVAVLGFGSRGPAHTLSLRDSGADVRIGLLESSEKRAKAVAEGLRVLSPSDALFFSYGFNIRYGFIKPPATVDFAMVAPKGPGHLVRRQYVGRHYTEHNAARRAHDPNHRSPGAIEDPVTDSMNDVDRIDIEDRFTQGKQPIREVHGAAGGDFLEGIEKASPDLAMQLLCRSYGEIYGRPGLDPRDRQLVTLGILTAPGGCAAEMKLHVRASLNVGITQREILEALLHATVYCGMPRAIQATVVANDVFVSNAAS